MLLVPGEGRTVPRGVILRPRSSYRGEMRPFSTAPYLQGSKRNPLVTVAIRTVSLFVKDLDGRIFPLVGDFSRSPYVDKHVVSASDKIAVVDFP